MAVLLSVRLAGGVACVEEAVLVRVLVGVGIAEVAWGLRFALIRITRIVGIAALLLGLRLLIWRVCPVFRLTLRLLSVAAVLIRIVCVRVSLPRRCAHLISPTTTAGAGKASRRP